MGKQRADDQVSPSPGGTFFFFIYCTSSFPRSVQTGATADPDQFTELLMVAQVQTKDSKHTHKIHILNYKLWMLKELKELQGKCIQESFVAL